jgi:flagellar biosynthetic protein FliQ
MTDIIIVEMARKAILLALLLSGPMMLVSLGIGLIVSIVQSVTQIQEQTLTYVPKLFGVSLVFLVALPWMIRLTVEYTGELFRSFPSLIH